MEDTTDPTYMREIAGRGNVVNPLDFSPADPELSKILEDKASLPIFDYEFA